MKKVLISFVAFVMVASFSNKVVAQSNTEATENTAVYAKLIKVMTIENANVNGLDFGTIVLTTANAASVVMATTGSRTYTGCEAAVNATQSENVAAYNVTGTPNETYALVIEDGAVLSTTTTATGGATVSTMTISNMTARFNGAGADATTSTLASDGSDSFVVGGKLNINAAQIPGVYSGDFDVTVDYN